jgi:uncharacterized protein (TIGR03118 family)
MSQPAQADYVQTNLVSDGAVAAAHTDANLKNPWGMSLSGGSPFWVSDQVTGVSTLYTVNATNNGTPAALVVTIPGGSPTGQVFNSTTSDFQLNDSAKASFLFSTLGGTLSGWNNGEGMTAQQVASVAGAVFAGLALGNNGAANFLYAANLAGGINVFDKNFSPVTLSGSFSDPNLPSGYTPYNIQNINGTLYVAYVNFAKGGGFVDTYDTNGKFIARVASNGTLNTPWGLALAPSTFGPLANDLLVGNLADGRISAFDPSHNYAFAGLLTLSDGTVFSEPGLWALSFGNGGNGGFMNTLYFAAGINNQKDGLFGSLASVPEPSAWLLGLIALGMCGGAHWIRTTHRTATATATCSTP